MRLGGSAEFSRLKKMLERQSDSQARLPEIFFICFSEKWNLHYCIESNALIATGKSSDEVIESISGKKGFGDNDDTIFLDFPDGSDFDDKIIGEAMQGKA